MALTAAAVSPIGHCVPYFDEFVDNSSDHRSRQWLGDCASFKRGSGSSGEDDDECSCDTNVTNKIANLNEENKKR
jgi:hypothetical protein